MIDELTPIAVFMAHEMNANSRSPDCRRMGKLNSISTEACVAEYFASPWWQRLFGALSPKQCLDLKISSEQAALMMWGLKVRQDGEWDHKPKLHRFISPTTKTWSRHAYGKTLYYYDIWSNLHYGYVGMAAGFTEGVLLDGAGLEQIGTDVLRMRWPKRSLGVEGLRAWDDASDRTSISLGIRLHDLVPSHVSATEIVQTILMTPGLDTQPLP